MTPIDPLACALYLIVSLSLAGLFHSAWLRSATSRRLAIPLDGGRTLRGRRIFGDNKTVRGFVVMVPATALMFMLAAAVPWIMPGRSLAVWPLTTTGYAALGTLAGFGFMLGELPNSFVKRQLGVSPGTSPRGRTAALLSFLVDRLDSVVGMLIAIGFMVPVPALTWAYMLVIGPMVHFSFSALLHRLGVKARAA